MTGTGAQGFGLRLRTERTRLYAVSCRKVKLHGLCRLGGILTSRRTHPLTHMASKAAAISPTRSTKSAYEEYVNPQWVSLLKLLGLNEEYERCQGTALYTKDGRRILDFLSGYCVHNAGHNHPHIVRALKDELDRSGAGDIKGGMSVRTEGKD